MMGLYLRSDPTAPAQLMFSEHGYKLNLDFGRELTQPRANLANHQHAENCRDTTDGILCQATPGILRAGLVGLTAARG